jgi:hypothetical protein
MGIASMKKARVKVVTPGGDLRSTSSEYLGSIWCLWLTRTLSFNHADWMWEKVDNVKHAPFFNHSIKHSYRSAFALKTQDTCLSINLGLLTMRLNFPSN